MKLYGVTTVYNEAVLVPIVMPYLEKLGYDKLIVLDNGSTDNTAELLRQYDFIEIRRFETENFDEDIRVEKIKEVVDEFKADNAINDGEIVWVTTNDFDEVIQYNDADEILNFKLYLYYMWKLGYRVCREHIYNLMEDGKMVSYGTPFFWNKPSIFCVNELDEVKITYGMHDTKLRYNGQEGKIFFNTKLISRFHLKYYNVETFLTRQEQRSNREFLFGHTGNGGRYTLKYSGDAEENIKKYKKVLETAIPYSDFLKHKILNGVEYIGEYE